MVILRAIGGFFCKIGRWIRDTAWVQPLLIVGGIFAIIFSIKPITNAIQGAINKTDDGVSFYKDYRKSLEHADEKRSDADKLIDELEKGMNGKYKGQKFFLSFVKEDCEGCKNNYPGFKTLKENWNKDLFPMDGNGFQMYTIFIDQKDSNGKYLIDNLLSNHIKFFETINSKFEELCDSGKYYYYNNISDTSKKSFKANLESIADSIGASEEEKAEGFVSPTTYLFDLTGKATLVEDYCVSQCFFNYTTDSDTVYGKDEYNKAYCLRDCWNGKSDSIWGSEYSK